MAILLFVLGALLFLAPKIVTPTLSYTGKWLQPAKAPEKFLTDSKRFAPGDYVAGQVVGQFSTLTAANDVQTVTITGTPTGGTFRLYDPTSGKITTAIAYNAAAAAVQTALEVIYGTGNVVVTGGPGPGTPWVVTFGGYAGNLPQQPLTVYVNSLTGGATPAVAVAHTTTGRSAGGTWGIYDDTASNGLQVAKGAMMYDTSVNALGQHKVGGGTIQRAGFSAVVVIGGYVRTSDLTGLDAAAIADLGRITDGDAGNLTNVGTILRII